MGSKTEKIKNLFNRGKPKDKVPSFTRSGPGKAPEESGPKKSKASFTFTTLWKHNQYSNEDDVVLLRYTL